MPTYAHLRYHVVYSFNSTNAERIMKMYPASSFKSPYFQLSRIIGDFSFTCAARRTARWMLAAGAPSSHVYVSALPTAGWHHASSDPACCIVVCVQVLLHPPTLVDRRPEAVAGCGPHQRVALCVPVFTVPPHAWRGHPRCQRMLW